MSLFKQASSCLLHELLQRSLFAQHTSVSDGHQLLHMHRQALHETYQSGLSACMLRHLLSCMSRSCLRCWQCLSGCSTSTALCCCAAASASGAMDEQQNELCCMLPDTGIGFSANNTLYKHDRQHLPRDSSTNKAHGILAMCCQVSRRHTAVLCLYRVVFALKCVNVCCPTRQSCAAIAAHGTKNQHHMMFSCCVNKIKLDPE